MPRFAIQIDIVHLPGVADPAGATVERALPSLGYTNVTDLKIAKTIRFTLEAADATAAEAQTVEMCERILANPVIEDYSVAVRELIAP